MKTTTRMIARNGKSSRFGAPKKYPGAVRHVLAAADFSDGSKAALRYGAQLAAAFDATVTVVNVVEVNDGWLQYAANDFPVLDEQVRANRKRTLQSFARGCGADGSWRYVARLGKPAEEIAAAAREANADIIVIATRGFTGLKHAVIGSTAEQVVRSAPCPVWIVPAKGAL